MDSVSDFFVKILQGAEDFLEKNNLARGRGWTSKLCGQLEQKVNLPRKKKSGAAVGGLKSFFFGQ